MKEYKFIAKHKLSDLEKVVNEMAREGWVLEQFGVVWSLQETGVVMSRQIETAESDTGVMDS